MRIYACNSCRKQKCINNVAAEEKKIKVDVTQSSNIISSRECQQIQVEYRLSMCLTEHELESGFIMSRTPLIDQH